MIRPPGPWRVVWALCVLRGRVASALWRIGIASFSAALHSFYHGKLDRRRVNRPPNVAVRMVIQVRNIRDC